METMRYLRFVFAALLAVLLFVPDAHAQIELPGTQPGDLENWPLIDPNDCQLCHGGYVSDDDYEPYDTWSGSMMANSARDPLFWAAVDIANQDLPGSGEFCIRCHSPKAWLEGRSSVPDGSSFQGYPDEANNDFDGVDCHFCHRMYEGEDGQPFTQNGQFWIDDGTPTVEPPRYGPYDDAFASHPTAQSDYNGSSELCGSCHDLKNPLVELVDENGQSTGLLFPEQLTYTEWANSAFAAEGTECQDCHMPDSGADPAFACNSFTPPRPVAPGEPGVSRHDLAGANTFIPRVLKGEYGAALGREAAYDYTIAKALEMLQEKSATIEVTAPTVAASGGSAEVSVRVTNLTGHKLPTGYPEGRRMWIHMTVTDAEGTAVYESGSYDPQTAVLSEDPQLRIYQAKHGQDGQGPGFHLVLNNRIYFDSRIPPRGFTPVPGSEPVGVEYPEQPDGTLAHWDDATYTFDVPAGTVGPLQVDATLRYQTASRDYIEFLRDENVSGPDPHDRDYPNAPSRGEKMHTFWTNYGKSEPVDMVSATADVAVVVPPANIDGLAALSGHNQVQLDWTLPVGASGVKILRAPWNGYPEYDSAGGLLPPGYPEDYTAALSAGWVEVYDGAGTSFMDTTFDDTTRDVWSYVAFAYDAQGAFALGSADARLRAPSYRLGDLGDVGVPDAYDGLVDGLRDLPVFSLAYGATPSAPGWNPEADIAPAVGVNRVPRPDDVVDFDDLVVFATQFGTADPLARPAVADDRVSPVAPAQLVLGPARKDDGATVMPLRVDPVEGSVRAVHVTLRADGVDPGQITVRAFESATVFAGTRTHDGGTDVDVARLGPLTGSAGLRGHVADVVVRGLAPDAVLDAVEVDVRDANGAPRSAEISMLGSSDAPASAPSRAMTLSDNVPNPFNPRTRLELELQRDTRVDVAVYDLAGRRIRTLAQGELDAGRHDLIWRGVDETGNAVGSGVYLVRALGDGASIVRRVALVR